MDATRRRRPVRGAADAASFRRWLALSNAFVTARGDEAARAYAHAAVAVDFLERRFGFPALREALEAFGRGASEAAVLEKMTGLSADALEREFRAELARRFARYDKQYLPPQPVRPSAVPAAAKGRRQPAQLGRARPRRAARRRSRRGEARRSIARARCRSHPPTSRRTRCSSRARSRSPSATPTPPWPRSRACSTPARRRATATRCACGWRWRRSSASAPPPPRPTCAAPSSFDPSRVEPHALLAELFKSQQRIPDRLAELEAALRLDPQTDRVAKEVVLGAAKAGRSARVTELAPIAIFIDPAESGSARGARPGA